MKIRFLKPWRMYAPGQIIDPPASLGDTLVHRGIAARVDEAPEISEPDSDSAPMTMAVIPPRNAARKRGRPRKVTTS